MAWHQPEEYIEFEEGKSYTPAQLDQIATQMLREAANVVDHTCDGEEDCGCKTRGIKGENPILFESHLINRKRREIMVTSGTPDPSIVQGLYFRCVDDETEALTPQGWKGVNEIQIGDQIWAYDIKTDSCLWQEVTDLYRNDTYNGPMQVLESKHISARTTPGHRWAAAKEWRKERLFETTELADRDYIPLARPPQDLQEGEDLDLYELLGWIITDGTYHAKKASMVIYQTMHNKKTPSLLRTLKACGVASGTTMIDKNNVGHWRIPAALGHKLRAIAPEKRFASIDFSKLTAGQRQALLNGAVLGDGHLKPSKLDGGEPYREIASTIRSEIDALQALATLTGISTSLSVREDPFRFLYKDHVTPAGVATHGYIMYLKERTTWAYVRNSRQPDIEVKNHTIWCPSVGSGFWVARRDNKVYVTGNSHPEGRPVNSPEARRKSGLSFYR